MGTPWAIADYGLMFVPEYSTRWCFSSVHEPNRQQCWQRGVLLAVRLVNNGTLCSAKLPSVCGVVCCSSSILAALDLLPLSC
jgi:hypothetical protein